MYEADTVAALSSATGPGLRIIVRLSGPTALAIGSHFVDVALSPGARLVSASVRGMKFPAWAYVFAAPRSYTGEHLVEFHIPGNPLLAKMLLEDLLAAGARAADPGEFTARAYFNGRLDLSEAEGVAAIISAGNDQELAAARRLLSGELARRLETAIDALANALALLEVGIDFSDEDVTFLSPADLAARVSAVDSQIQQLLDESVNFERLSHEPMVVLVGRPNAGKSTLLNALAGRERAVVSPVVGTTRDVLSAEVNLVRGVIRLCDVAGLEARDSDCVPAELNGQVRQRALRAMEEADHIILVRDLTDPLSPIPIERTPDLIVWTKADLVSRDPGRPNALAMSAKTGQGLDQFREALDRVCFGRSTGSATLALNARHIEAVEEARRALARACPASESEKNAPIHCGAEFTAMELREALNALSGITGTLSPDDLLGRIFSAFCIGK